MLSSIHPLGERARGNRWGVTVTAFSLGTVLAGAVVGELLGFIGSGLGMREHLALLILGALAVIAGGLDLAGVKAAGPSRKVNERWIGSLRGTIYGFGFGAQLGSGLATFVVTLGVWVVFIAELLTGSAAAEAFVRGMFGLGRAVAPLAAGWIDRALQAHPVQRHPRPTRPAGPSRRRDLDRIRRSRRVRTGGVKR